MGNFTSFKPLVKHSFIVSIATKGREGGDEARKESNQNRGLAERGGPAT